MLVNKELISQSMSTSDPMFPVKICFLTKGDSKSHIYLYVNLFLVIGMLFDRMYFFC